MADPRRSRAVVEAERPVLLVSIRGPILPLLMDCMQRRTGTSVAASSLLEKGEFHGEGGPEKAQAPIRDRNRNHPDCHFPHDLTSSETFLAFLVTLSGPLCRSRGES